MEAEWSFVLLMFTYLVQNICCDTWTYESEIVHNSIMQINSNGTFNTSQLLKTIKTIHPLECSIMCNKESAMSFYFVAHESTCFCNSAYGINTDQANTETGITYGYKTSTLQMFKYMAFIKRHHQPEPIDCKQLYDIGYREDGVYMIRPGDMVTVDVWCDMANGGWTVIQRRQDGSESFNRTWTEYVQGFGNKTGEYWLGLATIRLLVVIPSGLAIEMETFSDITPNKGLVTYNEFAIDDAYGNYKLSIKGLEGDVGDSLIEQSGQMFTTLDSDNDSLDDINCAKMFSGGWWYRNCHTSNLNGEYTSTNPSEFGHGIIWSTGWGFEYSLSKTTIKVIRT